jgi:transcriptional regulator with XRE-family HTH domain
MGLKQTVASNVRTLRKERGYTQKELSKLAGINHKYAGMIEREERSPTVDILEKIATALKVEPVTLLTGSHTRAKSAS